MTTHLSQPVVHSGFLDLLNLVAFSPSKLVTNSNFLGIPGARKADNGSIAGLPYSALPDEQSGPSRLRATGGTRGGRGGGGLGRAGKVVTRGREEWKSAELRKRKVDKALIGPPKDFRHIFHASTFEEATELLLRWSIEGVGDKLGDPAWASPIRQLVQVRAREQQARAVAAVVEATARSRMLRNPRDSRDLFVPPFSTLHVVNGLPSSIYSTVNTTILPSPTCFLGTGRGGTTTSVSLALAGASTPNLVANLPGNYFDRLPSGLRTPTSPLANPFASPTIGDGTPISPPDTPKARTRPLVIKKRNVPSARDVLDPGVKSSGSGIHDIKRPTAESAVKLPTPASSPGKDPTADHRPKVMTPARPPKAARRPAPSPSTKISPLITPITASPDPQPLSVPFRVIKPSLPTLEKAMSIALYFEQYYHSLLGSSNKNGTAVPVHPGNYLLSRARRLAELESTFLLPENRFMSESEKDIRREGLTKEENRWLREKRHKVDAKGFEMGRVIGHGAFGVVRIAREKNGGRLVAVKQLRKADMLRKSQEGHVRAEHDLLTTASLTGTTRQSWIVSLHYAFQDSDHLYLVLEYMGGGDLLNLLVERDTFPESMTRFYIAEMILALEQTHELGYIHRDIKPDNFLFTPDGHIRVSDFGLATDLHWAHDSGYYEQQRLALLKKHGVDLELGISTASGGKKTRRLKKEEVEKILGKEWMERGEGMLTWRDKGRKRLAYSVCGTNSYMAPEVIRGQGYGFSCDWWSLGIIMYESLYGYPPFVSSSRHITRQKILNWKINLKFPPTPRLSPECLDLLTCLLCEPEDRLGSQPDERASILTARSHAGTRFLGLGSDGADRIKPHKWFRGTEWDNLHNMTPPYHPDLQAEDDTRHFDLDIPDEPLAPAGGANPDATKDPLLGDKTHGAHLLEIRKGLAFKGWTFKSPHFPTETRYGHLGRISSGGDVEHMRDASEDTITGRAKDEIKKDGRSVVPGISGGGGQEWGTVKSLDGYGTVRSRALSF